MTERIQLTDAPDTTRLLLRAVRAGRSGARRAPDVEVTRTGVAIDQEHLAAYSRVCGFGYGATIPVTYPHVVGFPMALLLLTRDDAPLPLVGSVHVENHTTWTRPLRPEERVDLTVRTSAVRPHRKGRALDVITEVSSAGEQVWRETSTYLARGPGDPQAVWPPAPRLDDLPAATTRIDVPGDIGRRYAAVSGDYNPIHLHALTARPFGFRGAIAHGMWAYARTVAAMGRLPEAGSSSAWFRAPVPLGRSARLAVRPDRRLAVLTDRSGERQHLIVTAGGADRS